MRYARQKALKQIGSLGQKQLSESKVAIIGVGALGTVSCELLVRAGIGEILIVDKDLVHEVNLQRQLFEEEDVGKEKVVATKEKVKKINSDTKIKTKTVYLNDENSSLLDDYELILDCTDNMKARHVINDYCKKNSKMWIYAAGSGVTGNILVVDNPDKFSSIFKSGESFDSCEEIGVLNTLTTIIASLQVTEAIKILLKKGYCKELIRFNIWENNYNSLKIN